MTSPLPATSRRLLQVLLTLLVAGTLLTPLTGAPAQGAPLDRPAQQQDATLDDLSNEEAAEQALEIVDAAISPGRPETPATPDPAAEQEFMTALRDLSALQSYLSPARQRVAARLLARPTDAVPDCEQVDAACFGTRPVQTECDATLCVHYTTSGSHRVPAENDGAGGKWSGQPGGAPDYVEFALATVASVADRYVTAGYRPAKPDDGADGTPQIDIYLADIGGGAFPLYGYCWTDEPQNAHVAVAPYCVLDNDYSPQQFPNHTPQGNLRVTAAHEYFHAVQFAYDFYGDAWFLEASATWAEEVLYDSVNDNRQYLVEGPLGRPGTSIDEWGGLTPYASWIFLQYLTQRFPRVEGGMPVIVREIWEKLAHQGAGAQGMYSIQGIGSALKARGTRLGVEFARFAAWNRRPWSFYAEGAAYRPAPLAGTYRIAPNTARKSLRFNLDHLTARHYRFTSAFRGRAMLQIRLNLNGTSAGGFAYVLVKPRGQAPQRRKIALNGYGNAVVNARFGGTIAWVEVQAVNASTRFRRCNSVRPANRPYYTCGGFPVDDNAGQVVTVRAVR